MIINLRAYRTRLGYSQVKLAHESKVSLPTIQNIEAGKANPTIDVLEKLYQTLGLELKITPQEFDVEKAIALGVPLSSSSNTSNLTVISPLALKLESRKWHHALEKNTLDERTEIALISLLTAIKDHYPTFFINEMSCPVFETKIKQMRFSGKVIKLRRLALQSVSKYL